MAASPAVRRGVLCRGSWHRDLSRRHRRQRRDGPQDGCPSPPVILPASGAAEAECRIAPTRSRSPLPCSLRRNARNPPFAGYAPSHELGHQEEPEPHGQEASRESGKRADAHAIIKRSQVGDLREDRCPVGGPQAQDCAGQGRHGPASLSGLRTPFPPPGRNRVLSRLKGPPNGCAVLPSSLATVAEPEHAVGTVEADHLGSPRAIGSSQNGFGLVQSVHVHRGYPGHRGYPFNAVRYDPLPRTPRRACAMRGRFPSFFRKSVPGEMRHLQHVRSANREEGDVVVHVCPTHRLPQPPTKPSTRAVARWRSSISCSARSASSPSVIPIFWMNSTVASTTCGTKPMATIETTRRCGRWPDASSKAYAPSVSRQSNGSRDRADARDLPQQSGSDADPFASGRPRGKQQFSLRELLKKGESTGDAPSATCSLSRCPNVR